jgi:hypothetical protein
LRETLGNDARLVLLNAAIWATLNAKYLLAANNLVVAQARDDLKNAHLFEGMSFVLASKDPLGCV